MNIFKGLLFLHGHINPADYSHDIDAQARQHYGAGTAAQELAPPLGNRSASRSWLGTATAPPHGIPNAGCIAGGCG